MQNEKKPMAKRQILYPLTGIRAIAAIMVFLHHFNFLKNPFLREFHIGVTLFFVLSGFLMYYNYADMFAYSFKGLGKYYLRRIIRIYPTYFLALVLYFVLFGFNGASPQNIIVLQFLLFKGFFHQHYFDTLRQSWSLTVEFAFYALLPFLLQLFARNKLYPAVVSVMLFLFGLWIGGMELYPGLLNPSEKFMIGYTYFGRSIEFLIGIFAGYLFVNRNTLIQPFRGIPQTYMAIFTVAISVVLFSLGSKNIEGYLIGTYKGFLLNSIVTASAFGFLLYALSAETNWITKLLSNKVAILLGNASYAFYLVHTFVSQKLLSLIGIKPNFITMFIMAWTLSIAIYLLFEKPVYDYLNGLLRRKS